ncbi:hypothetical protein [Pantoea ananatis]|uniref:hypothetical protein n=1 Tax=Pantoea ananas TaxID=553 RepID=UPI0005C661E3|nr:hypothetical protein [Pantoea ananatis]
MTTNSPNPFVGDVQALIDWLKPQIAELENICDELPFGLDEDDAMQLKVMRFALDRLNATAQPVSDGLYRIANHIAGAKNSLPQEWQDWAEEIESDLRKLAAAPGGQDD